MDKLKSIQLYNLIRLKDRQLFVKANTCLLTVSSRSNGTRHAQCIFHSKLWLEHELALCIAPAQTMSIAPAQTMGLSTRPLCKQSHPKKWQPQWILTKMLPEFQAKEAARNVSKSEKCVLLFL